MANVGYTHYWTSKVNQVVKVDKHRRACMTAEVDFATELLRGSLEM